MRAGSFQVVWWGLPFSFRGWDEDNRAHWGIFWHGNEWGFERMDPESSWSKVWAWRLYVGPLEVRRWTRQMMEIEARASRRDGGESAAK